MKPIKRVNVLGCPVDAVSYAEAEDFIRNAVKENKCIQVVPLNVDSLMKSLRDPVFLQELWRAELIISDGWPVAWAASILGDPIKKRVSGTNIVLSCAEISSETGCVVACIGGNFNPTRKAAEAMNEMYPGAKLHPIPTPFPLGEKECEELVNKIKDINAKIVLAALGAPRQERWMQAYLRKCEANVGIGIGSAFDIISGDKPRAPDWMQNHGFEWFYRMVQEPRRLGKRYLIEDSPFIYLVAREYIRKRFKQS